MPSWLPGDRIYRVLVDAYNSRAPYQGMLFEYDIKAFSPQDASERIPRTHYGPAHDTVRYWPHTNGPRADYQMARKVFPEWGVVSIELRPQLTKRQPRPIVWLSKRDVLLVNVRTWQEIQNAQEGQ
ncbi:hypothetical protein ABZ543_13310 [Streptomyces roseifaciens]